MRYLLCAIAVGIVGVAPNRAALPDSGVPHRGEAANVVVFEPLRRQGATACECLTVDRVFLAEVKPGAVVGAAARLCVDQAGGLPVGVIGRVAAEAVRQ